MPHYPRIKKLRKDHKLTQTKIAMMLGCPISTYSSYENGSRQISVERLKKLADFYHVSVDFLLGEAIELKISPPENSNGEK